MILKGILGSRKAKTDLQQNKTLKEWTEIKAKTRKNMQILLLWKMRYMLYMD